VRTLATIVSAAELIRVATSELRRAVFRLITAAVVGVVIVAVHVVCAHELDRHLVLPVHRTLAFRLVVGVEAVHLEIVEIKLELIHRIP
jgi:hypothetical protein